ncbi:MAG: acetolactate decarboxylase [Saprospiraceae bacterium]
MFRTMREGKLEATIALDTIRDKQHLYGLGPLALLKGEILIVDGRAYVAQVNSDSSMKVKENWLVKAPFFVQAKVEKWEQVPLPDSVLTITQLENYLLQLRGAEATFAFKLEGTVAEAHIHVVNLPSGTVVRSRADAHTGRRDFILKNTQAELIGFFSTQHQAVFTHHDSYVHIHLITKDRQKMGHLDTLQLKPGAMTLYLPVK